MSAPTLTEIAVQLKLAALREACGVEALEVLAARSNQQVFDVALREARLSAMLVGQAYKLIKALIPHEPAVRALLEAEQSDGAAAE